MTTDPLSRPFRSIVARNVGPTGIGTLIALASGGVAPVLTGLTTGQTPADGLAASATNVGNYVSLAGAIVSATATASINESAYDSANMSVTLAEGDVVSVQVVVEDDQANTRIFYAGERVATGGVAAPTLSGSTIPDQQLYHGVALGADIDFSTLFNGPNLTFAEDLNAGDALPDGLTLNPGTGVVAAAQVPDQLTDPTFPRRVYIKASNAGGALTMQTPVTFVVSGPELVIVSVTQNDIAIQTDDPTGIIYHGFCSTATPDKDDLVAGSGSGILIPGNFLANAAGDTLDYTTEIGTPGEFVIMQVAGAGSAYAVGARSARLSVALTPAAVAPALVSSSPPDNATAVAVGAVIDLVFDQTVSLGTGNIVLRDNDGGFADLETFDAATGNGDNSGTLTIVTTNKTNDTIRITPGASMAGGIEHAIRVASTAVREAATDTETYAGIADDTTLSFTTTIGAPALLSTSPADDATGVLATAAIDLVFDQAIQFGSGNVVLRDNDGGFADLETFDAAAGTGDGGGTLTIVTTTIANDTLRITPGSDLVLNREHAIRVASTAVEDAATGTNTYAGIADDTTLSFTTVASAVTPNFKNIGSVADGPGAISVAWPAHVAGDIGHLAIFTRGNEVHPATISGWVKLGLWNETGSSGFPKLSLWKRTAASGAEANVSIAKMGAMNSAFIFTAEDADMSEILGAVAFPDAPNFSCVAGVTAQNDTLVICLAYNYTVDAAADPSFVNAALSGVTYEGGRSTTVSADGTIEIMSGIKALAGDAGTTTATFPVGADDCIGIHLQLWNSGA